jgi:hypothetical protein
MIERETSGEQSFWEYLNNLATEKVKKTKLSDWWK